MTKTIIAFLDKEHPPSHSFIDGMLATEVPKVKNIKVELVTSGSPDDNVCRYKNTACLPLLYPRQGFYRFLNFFKVIILLRSLFNKNRNNEIVLFVRNDPIYLLACAFLKKKNMPLIFQSSFPHEQVSGGLMKRTVAKYMYKTSGKKIDGLLAVSPLGLKRIQRIFPQVKKGTFIPLLSDKNMEINDFTLKRADEKVQFIYIGKHSQPRKLGIILKAIVTANKKKLNAKFKFVGGSIQEIKHLRSTIGVKDLEEKNILEFIPKIPRQKIHNELMTSDIGICLIPPDEHYIEASPTKLTEYMGAGLAVIANYGINSQEDFIKSSNGGMLCEWGEYAIANCLIDICRDNENLITLKKNAYFYTKENLVYRNYLKDFETLIKPR